MHGVSFSGLELPFAVFGRFLIMSQCCYVFVYFYLFILAILLGHLKMPFEDIKNSLLAMDEKKFSEAHLKQLLLYAPDSKEVTNTSRQTGRPMKCTLNSTVGRNVLFL